MNIDTLNQELSKLCSIPECKRTDFEWSRIHEIEAILDHITSGQE